MFGVVCDGMQPVTPELRDVLLSMVLEGPWLAMLRHRGVECVCFVAYMANDLSYVTPPINLREYEYMARMMAYERSSSTLPAAPALRGKAQGQEERKDGAPEGEEAEVEAKSEEADGEEVGSGEEVEAEVESGEEAGSGEEREEAESGEAQVEGEEVQVEVEVEGEEVGSEEVESGEGAERGEEVRSREEVEEVVGEGESIGSVGRSDGSLTEDEGRGDEVDMMTLEDRLACALRKEDALRAKRKQKRKQRKEKQRKQASEENDMEAMIAEFARKRSVLDAFNFFMMHQCMSRLGYSVAKAARLRKELVAMSIRVRLDKGDALVDTNRYIAHAISSMCTLLCAWQQRHTNFFVLATSYVWNYCVTSSATTVDGKRFGFVDCLDAMINGDLVLPDGSDGDVLRPFVKDLHDAMTQCLTHLTFLRSSLEFAAHQDTVATTESLEAVWRTMREMRHEGGDMWSFKNTRWNFGLSFDRSELRVRRVGGGDCSKPHVIRFNEVDPIWILHGHVNEDAGAGVGWLRNLNVWMTDDNVVASVVPLEEEIEIVRDFRDDLHQTFSRCRVLRRVVSSRLKHSLSSIFRFRVLLVNGVRSKPRFCGIMHDIECASGAVGSLDVILQIIHDVVQWVIRQRRVDNLPEGAFDDLGSFAALACCAPARMFLTNYYTIDGRSRRIPNEYAGEGSEFLALNVDEKEEIQRGAEGREKDHAQSCSESESLIGQMWESVRQDWIKDCGGQDVALAL